jgi:hypothetical protein
LFGEEVEFIAATTTELPTTPIVTTTQAMTTPDATTTQEILIALYESDRASFRKSLKLSFKVAREKIGNGTRRVLGREKETSQ